MKNTKFLLIALLVAILSVGTGFFLRSMLSTNSCDATFIDSGLGISLNHSCDWDLTLKTDISSNYVFNEEVGLAFPTLNEFLVRFSKEASVVSVAPNLIATSEIIYGFKESSDFTNITDTIIRYKVGESWSYGLVINCEDVPAARINIQDPVYCATLNFNDIASERPAKITANLEADLADSDELVRNFFE